MNKKVGLLTVGILLLLIPSMVSSNPFFYVSDSRVEDRLFTDHEFILIKGYYFLVFDNTGYVSNNFTRIDSYVIYQITFEANNTIPVIGQEPVPAGEYTIIPFDFDFPQVFIDIATLIFHASERISAFVTNYGGLVEYLEELGHVDIVKQQRVLIAVTSVSSTLIVLLFATIIVIRYKLIWKITRRIRAYRNKKSGKRFKNIG